MYAHGCSVHTSSVYTCTCVHIHTILSHVYIIHVYMYMYMYVYMHGSQICVWLSGSRDIEQPLIELGGKQTGHWFIILYYPVPRREIGASEWSVGSSTAHSHGNRCPFPRV